MYVVLSLKFDGDSIYNDELFSRYHFPARYRTSINEGDFFVYYKCGNGLKREERQYFGCGEIGKITTNDNQNYYAELVNCKKFNNTVPIYLENYEYVEQLGCEYKRTKPNWQTAVRKLTKQAYDYIIETSEGFSVIECYTKEKETQLKEAYLKFFVEGKTEALIEISKAAMELLDAIGNQ